MDVAANAPAAAAPAPRRLPLARILFIAAAAALLIVGAGYALRFVSANAFHQERAFRVLDEIGAQLDNLQRTLTFQLNLMSDQLAGRECVIALAAPDRANVAERAAECEKQQAAYVRRLAVTGPRVTLTRIDEPLHARACGAVSPGARQYAFVVRPQHPGAPFTAFSCSAQTTSSESAAGRRQLNMIAFSGELTETIEGFVSQSFFDEVLVALGDGAVIASARPHARSERGRRLGVSNASDMLRRATGAETDEDKSEGSALPAQPTIFVDRIAGERYRVFVKVLVPAHEIYLDDSGATEAQRQERLYLIGLKRDDLRSQIADSIEPAGRFGLTILVLLAMLAWPLANLRAKAAEDPISWMEAIACLISLALIPAVLAVAVVWVWSYHGVLSWADAGARIYARQIAAVVRAELEQGHRVLAQYRPLYQVRPGERTAGAAPLRLNRTASGGAETALYVQAPIAGCNPQGDQTCALDASSMTPDDGFKAWSPFSSVFATDGAGRRDGFRYTVYDAPSVKKDANYSAREYFRALQQGRGWAARTDRDVYVAQRIFSGGDGSRVLQMAVPRACEGGGFCGVISGSLSAHSLSAAVSPPLLRFAVIDQRSGQVLFHSDDARSLAENFLVETEHNPRLRALVQIGQSDAFAGYYMGAAHRFYHAPIPDAPWSVVAFYPVREAGDLSWHAVLTALAAYCGAMLVILAATALVLWVWFKRSRQGVRNLAARFWHRIGSPCSYARWGVSLFGGAAVLVLLYELAVDLRHGGPVLVSPVTWAMCGLALAAWIMIHWQHKRASHSVCIALWMLLVSAAPAAWIALGHHDAQVRGLLRDALVSQSRDVVQRQAAIASDLRRWLSNGDARASQFPDPWVLAAASRTMPIAGYTSNACGLSDASDASNSWTSCVFGPPPLGALITKRDLDFWRRETWGAAAQDEAQQRRIELLGDTHASNPSCTSTKHTEECTFRSPDGRNLVMRVDLQERPRSGDAEDEARFETTLRTVLKLGAVGVVLMATWALGLFASRRLLGVRDGRGCAPPVEAWPVVRTTLFHTRGLDSDAVERLLDAARPQDSEAPAEIKVMRVNLATDALFTKLPEKSVTGPVLLTNLDIALTDATRRRDILVLLERLVEDRRVQLLLHSRRSPLERLYHPERFPESGPDHILKLDEALRWDNVLQKLDCMDISRPERPRRHAHLSAVDHHRTWKLCTRAERLLLYQLATDRLANPRNQAVIDALIAHGLVRLNPWPQIVDPDFEAFVRTAENSKDLAEWQREASRTSGKRVRNTIITVALMVLVVAVVWFNWTASDQFKIVSTILAASVAFLSQMGQAFSFVRSGAGKGS